VAPSTAGNDHAWRGVLLVVCAGLFFIGNDTTTKHLAQTVNVPFIIFVRYAVNLVLTVAIFTPIEGKSFMRTNRTGLVVFRGACLAVASFFLALSLKRMQVAEVTAMVFLAPMLVVLVAGPVLGERVAKLDWLAAILGFSGVMLIARPGGDVDFVGLVYMSITVAVSVVYLLLSRILSKTESNSALTFYGALAGTLAFSIFLPWSYQGLPGSVIDFVLLLGLGVLAGLGHYLLTSAFRYANASVLAPLQYLQMLWAGVLGFLVFGNVPSQLSLLGLTIIAVSGAIIALKAKLSTRQSVG
jgi:drug/metabolite transporter (DMT)-like permease